MSDLDDLLAWLRSAYADYAVEAHAVFRKEGDHAWPLVARDADDLTRQLDAGGHFVALPKESAALANIIEVAIVDHLIRFADGRNDVTIQRGTERGYPDMELSGPAFGDKPYAVDVKVARRHKNGYQTQSRITLYTGNTYFAYPTLHWPNTFRPFDDYAAHLDIIGIYTLNNDTVSRVDNFEIIVQESWRIGSKQRSSTTREYIGAVIDIEKLRAGEGEFKTPGEFYKFWQDYPFKVGKAVKQQLQKMLRGEPEKPARAPRSKKKQDSPEQL